MMIFLADVEIDVAMPIRFYRTPAIAKVSSYDIFMDGGRRTGAYS